MKYTGFVPIENTNSVYLSRSNLGGTVCDRAKADFESLQSKR